MKMFTSQNIPLHTFNPLRHGGWRSYTLKQMCSYIKAAHSFQYVWPLLPPDLRVKYHSPVGLHVQFVNHKLYVKQFVLKATSKEVKCQIYI